MRILHYTDPHFSSYKVSSRTDDYPNTVLKKLGLVYEVAKQKGCSVIVCSGDFLNSSKVVKRWENELISFLRKWEIPHLCCIGNHEILHNDFSSVWETSLGTLFLSDCFKKSPPDFIYESDECVIVLVPYISRMRYMPLSFCGGKKLVLVAHAFLDFEFTDEAILPKEYTDDFDFVLLGHDHRKFDPVRVGRAMVSRPGSLLRTRLPYEYLVNDSDAVYVSVVDTGVGSVEYVSIPCAPVEEVFSFIKREASKLGSDLFTQLSSSCKILDGMSPYAILEGMSVRQEVKERVLGLFREYGV